MTWLLNAPTTAPSVQSRWGGANWQAYGDKRHRLYNTSAGQMSASWFGQYADRETDQKMCATVNHNLSDGAHEVVYLGLRAQTINFSTYYQTSNTYWCRLLVYSDKISFYVYKATGGAFTALGNTGYIYAQESGFGRVEFAVTGSALSILYNGVEVWDANDSACTEGFQATHHQGRSGYSHIGTLTISDLMWSNNPTVDIDPYLAEFLVSTGVRQGGIGRGIGRGILIGR
jgi:hypothetical protein